jgi:hypothetical protein
MTYAPKWVQTGNNNNNNNNNNHHHHHHHHITLYYKPLHLSVSGFIWKEIAALVGFW